MTILPFRRVTAIFLVLLLIFYSQQHLFAEETSGSGNNGERHHATTDKALTLNGTEFKHLMAQIGYNDDKVVKAGIVGVLSFRKQQNPMPELHFDEGGEPRSPHHDGEGEPIVVTLSQRFKRALLAKPPLQQQSRLIEKDGNTRTILLSPSKIRFSEGIVASRLSNKSANFSQLVALFQRGDLDDGASEILDVVRMPDGRLTALDNRPLAAARIASGNNRKTSMKRFQVRVSVEIHSFDEALDEARSSYLNPARTWGEAVLAKLADLASSNNNSKQVGNPFYGSDAIPDVIELDSSGGIVNTINSTQSRTKNSNINRSSKRPQ